MLTYLLQSWAVVSGVMFAICMSGMIHKRKRDWRLWASAFLFSLMIPIIWVVDQFSDLYKGYFDVE